MADKAWKKFERDAASLFWGARFWANAGERVDFSGRTREGLRLSGQCKLVKSLSLNALTQLAEEPGVDVVCVKVRRGSGKVSSGLVVMTFEKFKEFYGETREEKEAEAALRKRRQALPTVQKEFLSSQDA